jgi:hypothetical protein
MCTANVHSHQPLTSGYTRISSQSSGTSRASGDAAGSGACPRKFRTFPMVRTYN